MITLFKFRHRNETYIGIRKPISVDSMNLLKSTGFLKYSKTKSTWYFPYSRICFSAFKKLNIRFSIELKNSGTTDVLPSKSEHTSISNLPVKKASMIGATVLSTNIEEKLNADIQPKSRAGDLEVEWNGKGFRLKLPFVQSDIDFLKNLKGSYWNENFKCWVLRSNLMVLKALQQNFNIWGKDEYEKLYGLIGKQTNPQVITLYQTPQHMKKVIVKIEGFGADVAFIKSIPNRNYDKEYRRWIIPYSAKIVDRIVAHYSKQEAKIVNRLPTGKLKYITKGHSYRQRIDVLVSKFTKEQRPTIQPYIELLTRQHYSWSTVTSYCKKMGQVMRYFKTNNLDQLSVDDINNFLYHLAKRDVSSSALNVVFSAIKLYYERVALVDNFNIEKMKRPKKGRTLPTILSITEVERMLRSIRNLKHLSILYTIYGGGLRLNEIINLRVQDIHWERNQLLIHKGKGRKDRMVMLSSSLKELLERYFEDYKPQYWLFEGKDGNTNYNSRSVQAIVKKAAKKAGISRKVSPHTLRHCFATHLLDHGTDVRYIQELLGHRDIKTTLIYTHVTNKRIGEIESPLDRISRNSIL